ncbi:hypothetical protein Patl1_29296 [Pistacia atlantica]|uniref:Uncharacterized protein n=1 Tax=Pistacia atlantica TaxID=434234 RepID=A0ACC1BGX5_9ROSI|nr:hypothetical protein Patl1_29296 [Pistacia atlantica]
MGFWTLFEVATMPILQVLLISLLGAFMATEYCNLLPTDARKSLNKIVFMVFTPCLMFASLAQTVTLEDIISWWFMPVNIGLTFLFGGILGWIVLSLQSVTRKEVHLGIVMFAPLLDSHMHLSPWRQLGGFYIWTYSYHLVRSSSIKYKALQAAEDTSESKVANKDFDATPQTRLLKGEEDEQNVSVNGSLPKSTYVDAESQIVPQESTSHQDKSKESSCKKMLEFFHKIWEELMAPPTIAAIVGFIFGAVTWLRNLIIGDGAPLRVFQDSIKILGDGTIPCITLILGGNLIQGLKSSTLKPLVIIAVVCVRYIVLPMIGIWIVKGASTLGFLPSDPLYHYVLMIQFTLPPAMNIGK